MVVVEVVVLSPVDRLFAWCQQIWGGPRGALKNVISLCVVCENEPPFHQQEKQLRFLRAPLHRRHTLTASEFYISLSPRKVKQENSSKNAFLDSLIELALDIDIFSSLS